MKDATLNSDFVVVFFFFFSFGTLKKTRWKRLCAWSKVPVSDTIEHFTWMDTCNLRCRPFLILIFWIKLPGPHTSLMWRFLFGSACCYLSFRVVFFSLLPEPKVAFFHFVPLSHNDWAAPGGYQQWLQDRQRGGPSLPPLTPTSQPGCLLQQVSVGHLGASWTSDASQTQVATGSGPPPARGQTGHSRSRWCPCQPERCDCELCTALLLSFGDTFWHSDNLR